MVLVLAVSGCARSPDDEGSIDFERMARLAQQMLHRPHLAVLRRDAKRRRERSGVARGERGIGEAGATGRGTWCGRARRVARAWSA